MTQSDAMKNSFVVVVCCVLSSSIAMATAGEDPLDEPHMSLTAAQSIPVALKRFRNDQPKAIEAHFRVYVREQAEVVEIEFVPDASPLDSKCGEKDCVVSVDSGSSVYGYGLTYVVQKSTNRILKVTRSR